MKRGGPHLKYAIRTRVLRRERRARSMRMPAWSIRALDADGRVRGLTWRDMPGSNPITRACNWWLWKRGELDMQEARAEADAAENCTEGGQA